MASLQERSMVSEFTTGQMDLLSKGGTQMIKSQAMASSKGLMGRDLRENGQMEEDKEEEFS